MDKIKNYIKSVIENESVKQFRALILIIFIVLTSLGLITGINMPNKPVLYGFTYTIIAFPITLLTFLPAILFIYLIFKKIKNKIWRTLTVSLLIPLNIYLYHLFCLVCTSELVCEILDALVLIISIDFLSIVLPLVFIAILFVPKKVLPIKYNAISSIILMELCGLALMLYTIKS